ncbi:DUF362 domain-containing protein [Methanosarcina sp.]|uniref:DUF362 domain-containing protein n=1 Tax=Methanosarcina sp. TaxID=2213 RepID=UPI003BB57805
MARCEDYDRKNVYDTVRQTIDLIGGLGAFVLPGQQVFLKFNMLEGSTPEKCVTTHPEVVYAVAKLLKDYGCKVIMGDSPGSGLEYNEGILREAYSVCGYDEIAATLDIPLNYDTSYRSISAPESQKMKLFPIITPVLDADVVVVVSKAKTHALTYFSGAAKNIFGIVPGTKKKDFHANLPNLDDFCRMIIDLNGVIKPKLQVMDAIMGMEGDGPHTGPSRKIGAILASGDYGAIDVATCQLMSLEPMRVGTIRAMIERGYLQKDLSDVSIVGEKIKRLIVKDYKLPSTYIEKGKLRPVININRCISCMKCVRSCPVKTIDIVNKKPKINYKKCINCYCCHETCDTHAISLKGSLAGKRY